MFLDVKQRPMDKSLAEFISEKVSVYVRIAEFVTYKGQDLFRVMVDTTLLEKEIVDLVCLQIHKSGKTYKMKFLECVAAPVVDHDKALHQNPTTTYLRLTFL